jgi:hypothetical protein
MIGGWRRLDLIQGPETEASDNVAVAFFFVAERPYLESRRSYLATA